MKKKNTEKKTKSELYLKKSNLYLFTAGIVLFILFITGIILINKNKSNKGKLEIAQKEATKQMPIDPWMGEKSVLKSDKEKIELTDISINETAKRSLKIYAEGAPVQLLEITPSQQLPKNFNLEYNSCLKVPLLEPGDSCFINISWMPTEKIDSSFYLDINYKDARELPENDEEKSLSLTVFTKSKESKPEPIKEQPEQEGIFLKIYDLKTSDAFDAVLYPDNKVYDNNGTFLGNRTADDYVEREGEIIASLHPPAQEQPRQKTQQNLSCKKYAARAYDFAGYPMGWIQPNKDVYSNNCQEIIGYYEDTTGYIVRGDGSGERIGVGYLKGEKIDPKIARRAEISVPDLPQIPSIENTDTAAEDTLQENAKMNRKYAKMGYGGQPAQDWSLNNQTYDPMGVFYKYQQELKPPGIKPDNISSTPRKEKYVIRQYKPIPAVLVHPIQTQQTALANNTGNRTDTPVVAMVERNVYSNFGRTVIIPAGSEVIGFLTEKPIGVMYDQTHSQPPYLQPFAKINIVWHRLIRPDGAEFRFSPQALTGDAQGQMGVPGKTPTGYMKDILGMAMDTLTPIMLDKLYDISSTPVTSQKIQTYDDEGYPIYKELTTMDRLSQAKDQILGGLLSSDPQNPGTIKQVIEQALYGINPPFTIAAGTRMIIYPQSDMMLQIDETMANWESSQY